MFYQHEMNTSTWNRGRLRILLSSVLAFLLALLSLLLVTRLAIAEPYLPQDENLVLDQLPETLTTDHIKRLVSKLTLRSINEEQNETLQAELINNYITQAKITGDMRYISYAQNRLKKWLQEVPGSEKARLGIAYIQQYKHNFEQAIDELESLLKDYPENIDAWSLLSNIQLLTGNYQAAKTSCKRLATNSSLADTILCQSSILARTGSSNKAYQMLSILLSASKTMALQQQLWLHTTLAEIKIQQGDNKLSGIHLDDAMKLTEDNNIHDGYLSRLYIDYLAQNNRIEEALTIAQDNKNDSAMMIRAAVLARQLGDYATFQKNKTALLQVFEVEQRRGQNGSQNSGSSHSQHQNNSPGLSRHLREQALFVLLVLNDPILALELAQNNWTQQKEPEDARILMKSALAADALLADAVQFQQAKSLIEKTGLIDSRLEIRRLRESLL